MSDEIPFHIQEEIMKRLPVKSLVQFRCVSKAWKSLIDSSEFVAAHSLHRHTQPHHLLVSCENLAVVEDDTLFSRCYIDDETFPRQMSVPLPISVKQLIRPIKVGSSHGLLCLFGSHPNFTTKVAVLWNPSIRKSIVVAVTEEPSVGFGVCPITGYSIKPYVSFGVCPVTNDPKILMITNCYEFMVYTLSSGKWRSLSTNLLIKPVSGLLYPVVTDRFIYWSVYFEGRHMIMSFDLTSETFDTIDLPDSLVRLDSWAVHISKVRGSLAILQYGYDEDSTIWVMEHDGARISFTKLYTITTAHNNVLGFRKNGIPILHYDDYYHDHDGFSKLMVYDPKSEHTKVFECRYINYHFNVHSYMETLLLLGRSDYSSY